jgi:PAS domain S-box-containing protein
LIRQLRERHAAQDMRISGVPARARTLHFREGVVHDITRDRFTDSMWGSSIPLLVTRPDGEIVEASEAFLKMIERDRADVIGKSIGDIGLYAVPADRARMLERLRAEGKVLDHELHFKTRSGRSLYVLASIELVVAHGIEFLFGALIDVTARRELELQLRQAQKMESLGLLAGGMAHDFNNVLAVIAANAELLRLSIPETASDRELVDEIDAAVGRAADFTRQLLAFSRKQVARPIVVDVNAFVTEARNLLARLVGEHIALTTLLDPCAGRLRIDPGHLTQVLMNLAVNARDAMPDGGELAISTRASPRGVAIEIRDTGAGIPEDLRERIFEPFFTTKPLGEGSGMGLAVVLGIVQQAGGAIRVDSEVGTGTRFTIELPTVADPIDDAAPAAGTTRGSEAIVLTDDDPDVLRATARGLRSLGYTVFEANEAATALRLLTEHPEARMLITDVVMPGIDGWRLAEAARAQLPDLEVLFVTGYANEQPLRAAARGEAAVLEKPFRVHTLAHRIRQLLDR